LIARAVVGKRKKGGVLPSLALATRREGETKGEESALPSSLKPNQAHRGKSDAAEEEGNQKKSLKKKKKKPVSLREEEGAHSSWIAETPKGRGTTKYRWIALSSRPHYRGAGRKKRKKTDFAIEKGEILKKVEVRESLLRSRVGEKRRGNPRVACSNSRAEKEERIKAEKEGGEPRRGFSYLL